MADTKVSALTAASALSGTEEMPVVQSGASKKVTAEQITTFVKNRSGSMNASVTSQGAGFATDTYLTGSNVSIPSTGMQAKTMYRVKFHASKTAAGVATPIINIRFGTAATTADTSRGTLTFAAQTAVIDNAMIEIFATFRTVGSGTTAVLQTMGMIDHTLTATGFSTANTSITTATSGGFDSTVANSVIGISVNGGASAAWTVTLVQAELFNLA